MNKKLLSIVLVLTMVASMLSFVSVFAADNVIYTHSFESESEGWGYYGKDQTSLSTAKAKEGKSSLYVNDVSDSDSGGFNGLLVKIIPGETYTATVEAFNEVDGCVFMLRFFAADKKTKVKDSPQAKPTKKGEWETLTATLKAPEGAEYVRPMVATFSATKGTAYFDNCKLMGKSAEAVAQSPSTGTSSSAQETVKEEVKVEAKGSKYQLEIEFLAKLGLIDDAFKFDAQVTKAEMAKMIAKVMHPDVDFSVAATDAPAFNDVPSSHAYYPYIKACKDLGIIKGDYDNNFNPDAHITAIEAMTVVINALGYTPFAQAFGGYPTGYYSIASQTGISKGLNIATAEPITGEVAAKILYNALFADIVALDGITSDSIEVSVNNGKNILSERLGIFEYNALVVDNGITSITGDSINNPERAVIQDAKTGTRITAYVCDTNISEYLGYRVKAFVKNNVEDGRYEYVYVAPTKNEVITINAKYIFNATDSVVEYDEDDSTVDFEKINFGSVKPRIINNGVKKINSVAENIPQDGFVTFIENTGDSKFDLINIISFNETSTSPAWNIIVDTVDTTEGEQSISCMFNPINSLDLNDEEYSYSFAMNKEIKSLADLKKGDVVSVAKASEKIDGKTHYILVPSRNKVEGTLVGLGDNAFLLENGNEYEISSSVLDLKPSYGKFFNMSKKITLWIDATGNVAYAEGESGASKNYAYIVKAVLRQHAGKDVVLVKVFTKDGKMEELKLTEKCRIDGRQYTTAAKQLSAINARSSTASKMSGDKTAGRPVIMDVNSDKMITRIDTDNPNVNLGYIKGDSVAADTIPSDLIPVAQSEFYSSQQGILYSEEDADSFDTLNAGFRNPRASAFYDANMKSIEGKFFITGNTFVITTGEIDTYGNDADSYKKYSIAGSSSGDKYHQHPGLSIAELQALEGSDEDYKISKGSDIARSIKYDIQGYDIDPDTGVAALAVIRGLSATAFSTSAELCIYSRRTQVYDTKKEKSVVKLYYYNKAGKEVSVLYDNETLLPEYVTLVESVIKPGDVIRVLADKDGYVSSIDRIVSVDRLISKNVFTSLETPDEDSDKDVNTSYYIGYSNNTVTLGYANKVKGATAEIVGGTIKTKLSDVASSITDVKPSSKYFMDFSKVKPVVVTINGSEINVKEGSYDDIVTVKDVTNSNGSVDIDKASILVFRQSRFVPNYLIVFNGLDTYVSR